MVKRFILSENSNWIFSWVWIDNMSIMLKVNYNYTQQYF